MITIMTTATQAILKQALSLDPVERAELIEELFHSFDKAPDRKIDALWTDEAESRIDAYDAGQICADSAKAAFERIPQRGADKKLIRKGLNGDHPMALYRFLLETCHAISLARCFIDLSSAFCTSTFWSAFSPAFIRPKYPEP